MASYLLSRPFLALALVAYAIGGGWLAAKSGSFFSRKSVPIAVGVLGCSLIAIWSSATISPSFELGATLWLAWGLFVLAMTDLLAYMLPDVLTFPLIVSGLLQASLAGRSVDVVIDRGIGAVAGFVAFAGIATIYRSSRGREGLGMGDAKLLAAAGSWLGWKPLPLVVLLGCLGGFAWIGARALRGNRQAPHGKIAFGVPLCLAIWLVWLYGAAGL